MKLFLALLLASNSSQAADGWPRFRGPDGLGIASGAAPPVHFGAGTNVVWKIELPPGHSSPCVWGNRIFLTARDGAKLETLCIDRSNGNVLWRKAAPAEKIEDTHKIASPATPTPVTDGERVIVYFGSCGLLAYDFDGKELWRKPLPLPIVEFGTSSSPMLAGGHVILACDQDLGSFLIAANPRTGETVWKVDRAEFRRSFATPIVWRHNGAEELIVPGSIKLKSYSVKDGSELWTYIGTSRLACSSPVAGDGMLFSASWNIGGDAGSRISMPPFDEFARDNDKNSDGKLMKDEIPRGPVLERFSLMDFDKDNIVTPAEWNAMADMFNKAENAVLAIRPGGCGDITASHLAWKSIRSLPYVSSPLFYKDRLYTMKNGGLASCYNARTGEALYQDERVGVMGDFYSSAVAAAGHIFLASESGTVLVMKAGDELQVLARNTLGEKIYATPAIVDGMLYLRTERHLFAFGSAAR